MCSPGPGVWLWIADAWTSGVLGLLLIRCPSFGVAFHRDFSKVRIIVPILELQLAHLNLIVSLLLFHFIFSILSQSTRCRCRQKIKVLNTFNQIPAG